MQLISEFVITEIRPEDSGSFYCSAANPAGVATANFTVVVIDRDGATSSGGNVISDGDGDTITVVGDDKEGEGGDEDTMIKVG